MTDKEAQLCRCQWDFSSLRDAAEILQNPKRAQKAIEYAEARATHAQAGVDLVKKLKRGQSE